jgi:hypothetical protein
MKMDVLLFLALADQSAGLPFSRQTNSLSNTFDFVTPIDPASGYGQWKHVKNVEGWPWDLKLYDDEFIYDWVTEGPNGWSPDPNIGPKSFKKFVRNHLKADGSLADGLILCPRYIDSQTNDYAISIADSSTLYATFENCAQVGEAVSLGPVVQRLRGPFLIDAGGDVGSQPTLIHQYEWSNNGVPTREENFYSLNYGWTAWKLQTLGSNGLYKIVKSTLNRYLIKLAPKIVFPCF